MDPPLIWGIQGLKASPVRDSEWSSCLSCHLSKPHVLFMRANYRARVGYRSLASVLDCSYFSGGGAVQVQSAGQAGLDRVLPHRWWRRPRHLCGRGKALQLSSATTSSSMRLNKKALHGFFAKHKATWNMHYTKHTFLAKTLKNL